MKDNEEHYNVQAIIICHLDARLRIFICVMIKRSLPLSLKYFKFKIKYHQQSLVEIGEPWYDDAQTNKKKNIDKCVVLSHVYA